MSVADIISLIGGLGLFLLGMNEMSDGIEKAAGARLRKILEIFTTNKYKGIIVGTVFTAIIQSSSACTAMVVSFVNSGLMDLYQATGVILGANIGTTLTAFLVSLNLSKVAPLILFIGVIMVCFVKNKPMVQKIGEVILGFGVLFLGISTMGSSMEALKESPKVIDLFSSLTNPFVAVFIGMVVTALIQSSSVTVSIIIIIAQNNLFVDNNICLYIILGCNIGACATAIIASLAGKKAAKRAALIHLLFNIFGTILMFLVLQIAIDPISNLIHSVAINEKFFVSIAHLSFKVVQVIALLPFTNLIVKMTYLIVPGDDQKIGYQDSFQLQYIGEKVLFNPSTAVVDGMKELERMASLSHDNLNRAMNALITLDEDDIEEVYETEKNINFLNKSITHYLVKINQSTLPIEDLQGIGALFHVANDIERIGDHAENIADMATRRKNLGVTFSEDAQSELAKMLDVVNNMIEKSVKFILNSNSSDIENEINLLEDKVDKLEKKYQQNHIDRLTKQECTAEAGMIFSDVISGLERVADHAINIVKYLSTLDNENENT